jgi:hypothetical protein
LIEKNAIGETVVPRPGTALAALAACLLLTTAAVAQDLADIPR